MPSILRYGKQIVCPLALCMGLFFAGEAADTVIVDGMIVWSQEADGETNMVKLSQGLVKYMNDALARSGVAVKVRLVYAAAIDYTEGGTSSATSHTNFKYGRGTLGVTHDLRDTHGADLCCLICVNSGVIGRSNGWDTGNDNEGDPGNAFSTLRLRYLDTYPLILTHEWGHNLGCGHERSGKPAYDFSHAHLLETSSGNRRTIMYANMNSRESIPYFSNPDIEYDGVPTGVADSRDNARSIRLCAPRVSGYRAENATRDMSRPLAVRMPRAGFTVNRLRDGTIVICAPTTSGATPVLYSANGRSVSMAAYSRGGGVYRVPASALGHQAWFVRAEEGGREWTHRILAY